VRHLTREFGRKNKQGILSHKKCVMWIGYLNALYSVYWELT